MRIRGLQKRMYRMTYDKPGINKKALQFGHSLDEVRKLLDGVGHKKQDKK